MSYNIKTYGCRLNFYESEVIRKFAKENAIQKTTFINSCAVTNKAVADLKNEIRKSKKNEPDKKIVLTGCAAQIHSEEFKKMEEVDSILGNKEKLDNSTYLAFSSNRNIKVITDIFDEKKA